MEARTKTTSQRTPYSQDQMKWKIFIIQRELKCHALWNDGVTFTFINIRYLAQFIRMFKYDLKCNDLIKLYAFVFVGVFYSFIAFFNGMCLLSIIFPFIFLVHCFFYSGVSNYRFNMCVLEEFVQNFAYQKSRVFRRQSFFLLVFCFFLFFLVLFLQKNKYSITDLIELPCIDLL